MEEEECDYRTPIGKVIKHIITLCKKPQIDNRLSEALDLFNERLQEQEKYLINGIFKTNFVEAALFLQSSTELYGKKVDTLWDELLEFHTRLITYDCEHLRKKGLSVDKEVIERLEERRNRYKRKKKFKLSLQTTEAQKLGSFLFDDDEEKENKGKKNVREEERALRKAWREYEYHSREMRKIPNIVYKQMLKTYNMKNYPILKSVDFEIWDLEDDEFITRYSRVPSWHHIHHLFEYNDKGLLPDHNNIIARLRLSDYGRIRFMVNRGIPLGTPFEEYQEEYMAYREEFFAAEAKKWQNMPLDTFEDLRKQLQFLAQKERAEKGELIVVGETVKLGRYGVKVVDRPIENDKIEILDTSDEDSLFELSFSCDKDFMKSDLYVRLEKLSSEIINKKLRQDSGFFDFNSDSDHDCDDVNLHSSEKEGEGAATTTDGDSAAINDKAKVDIPAENSKDVDGHSVDINQNNKDDANENQEKPLCKDVDGTNVIIPNTEEDANAENQMDDHNCTEAAKPDDDNNTNVNQDNFETRSFISDHDYCLTMSPNLEANVENNCNNSGIDENVENVRNSSVDNNLEKENATTVVKTSFNKTVEEVVSKPSCTVSRIVSKIIKIIEKKQKLEMPKRTSNGESPPKRRKLSRKQIDKLLQSKIRPVRLNKFESFFSMNYLSEYGEGDVPLIDYESDYESDSPYPDDDFLQDLEDENHTNENNANINPPVIEDNSDTRSIHSDHDYCKPPAKDTQNDSGFFEASSSQPIVEEESIQDDQQENSSNEPNTAQSTILDDPFEIERQKVLAILKEGCTDTQEENVIIGPRLPTERERQELEWEMARERILEWRESITPILRGLKDEEFDIHEYGSKIMEGLEVNESKPFSDMVQGKSSAEVVRYFISSLQLANTNNIEICGAQEGKLSNDTYQVKLLTKDRYHEHLNEYLAPSEETLREKLDRMRAMNADMASPGEPPAKKIKLMIKSTKGKRNSCAHSPKKNTVAKNKKPLSSSNHNIQVVPSTSGVVFRNENNVRTQNSYQITPCKVVLDPIAQTQPNKIQDGDRLQGNFHNNDSARQERLLAKGKSIVKRPINRSQEPYILNADISMPSTSRDVPWPSSSTHTHFDMPSTSFVRLSPSPDLEDIGFSYNFQTASPASDGASLSKVRRQSTEESFRERLATAQEMNPDVQLQSTPNTSSPSKQFKTSSLRRSLMFE